MRVRDRFLAGALAAALALSATPAAATRERSTQLALQAKEALDAHFGSRENLDRAAGLLRRALDEDDSDATVYVQAARLTIKGGHLVSSRFRPGTLEAYGELLDRALALDPGNAKAHILKAEYFHLGKNYAAERAELDKANATGTRDSWLLIGYGRHYETMRAQDQAHAIYEEARARGPGASLEQRNAFVAAVIKLASFAARANDRSTVRSLAQLARNERHPRDAWTLGSAANSLVRVGMFDDAIAITREALRVMNYGVGRLTLVTALYGKAAQLTLIGKRQEAAPLIQEARSFGYSRAAILDRFACCSGPVTASLMPTLDAIVQ